MTYLRKLKGWQAGLIGVALCLAAAVPVALLSGSRRPHVAAATPTSQKEEPKPPEEDPLDPEPTGTVTVKTIHPKHHPSLEVTVEQPAFVEAYYRADLQARVAGPVKSIEKDIGDRVAAGEPLIEIDVPDLVQELAQKQAVVEQKKCDLQVAEASVRIARAAMDAAEKSIKQRESLAEAAEEEKEFRRKEYTRFKRLSEGPSPAVTPDVVDERLKWFNVAKANKTAAEVAVLKAKADLEEAREKVAGAQADVELKKSFIKVAEADRDRARAMLDLATIRAPFNGIVTRRTVDPGSFVHNAATANRTEPLLTVERTDIVTVYMKVPDRYAPYISRETEATIEMNELPGDRLRARVTRFTPSLQTPEHDRTMRVEVDLYNGSPKDYEKFVALEKATSMKDLKGRDREGKAVLPILPNRNGGEASKPLLPGMYGKMRLVLRTFRDIYLLPSTAVVSQGGTPYIFQVVDGVVHRVPVAVEMDDGKLARVRVLSQEGEKEVRRKLTGKEEIVSSNQGELTDGQTVEATHVEW